MPILNSDLINSCRVCRSPYQEGDCECLYQFSNKHDETPVLSEAGILYENLLNISLSDCYYYPQFLCNSCDLQMKLFKKLKDKAHKTLEYLQKLNGEEMKEVADVQQEILNGQEPFAGNAAVVLGYQEQFAEYQDRLFEEYQEDEINEYKSNIVDEFEDYVADEHQGESANENQDSTIKECQEYSANVCQENAANEYGDNISITCQTEVPNTDMGNNIAQAKISNDFMEHQLELKTVPTEEIKTSLNLSANISQLSLKLEPLMDKNDYVTEIYELLDDEETETYSENNEKILEFDVYSDEKTEQSSAFSDIEYIVEEEMYSTDENNEVIQHLNPAKKLCKSTSKNTLAKRVYKCKPCQLEFKNLQDHKLHRTQVHHKKHVCKICSKELKSATALHNHMSLHNAQPAYQCEICQKTFKQKVHYQYHMNNHNNVRNFKCDVCEKAFISKTDLKVHMRFHSQQRPYVCNICGKDYLMMEHLKTHMLSHTEQYFQCDICNHKFSTHKNLRLHVRTIHEDEPKFKCSFCLKPFRRKHHLQYHMKLHEKNVKFLDSCFEATYDPDDPDFLNEQDSIEDPGFIALNDDVI